MANLIKNQLIKTIDEKTKYCVEGYIRNAQNLFPNQQNPYYNIPIIAIHLCTLYYYIKDRFDQSCFGHYMRKIGNTISMTSTGSNSAFLMNVVDYGIHEWSFRLDKINRPDRFWRSTIGLCRISNNYNAPLVDGVYCQGINNGYGFSPVTAMLINVLNGRADDDDDNDDFADGYDCNIAKLGKIFELRSGKICTVRFIGQVHFAKGYWMGVELRDHFGPHDGAVRGVRYFLCPPKRGMFVKIKSRDLRYGIKCKEGDIVGMFVDMDKLELSYSINGKHYGTAYTITKDKYRAAIHLEDFGDAITLL